MPKIIVFLMLMFCASLTAQENPDKAFDAFTGKVIGNKVRMRTSPDLDSHIICQCNKDDLLVIVGEENEFYSIQPTSTTKAYIFRSYVIDNVIEADRVNLRLEPNTEAPIIGKMQRGDKIEGRTCEKDPKWIEFTPPENVKFYIAKDYIEKAGNAEYAQIMKTRKEEATRLLNSAYFITQGECKKPFNEMTPHSAIKQFEAIVQEYSDFPAIVQQAKEGLSLLQDNYLQKKIAYLEEKSALSETEKQQLFSEISIEKDKKDKIAKKASFWKRSIPDKMKTWASIEDSLFQAWSTFHPEKEVDDFYEEQKANALSFSGTIQTYNLVSKSKPGDYLLKNKDGIPIAYLYSTQIDLEKYVGKEVSMQISPRPNNNFALPAYFVHIIE